MMRCVLMTCAAVLWLVAATAGFVAQMNYERTPGAVAAPAVRTPDATLPSGIDRPAIILTLHPRCPCSRATLDELAEIVTKAGRPIDVVAVFVGPADWPETALWEKARGIPGVKTVRDEGRIAKDLGARTSGHAFVYVGGSLAFSGGLTAGRGVAGPGVARGAILGALGSGTASPDRAPVYGCPLGIGEDRP